MRVVWSPLAIERAYDAAKYIAADKPDAALRWLDGLFDAVDELRKYPESGRVVPEIGLEEFRELIYRKAYRVIYRVEKTRISILTVRNAAQLFDPGDLSG